MALSVKTWGTDLHPGYQKGIDLDRLVGLDYDFGFVKISEGPYWDGTIWNHPDWRRFALEARRTFPAFGAYHFLVNSHDADKRKGGRVQAELFARRLDQIGGPKGAALIVDFEHYSDDYPWLSPYNGNLMAFVARLKEIYDDHPVVLYTTENYWNSGIPSGPIADYGIDFLWEARYPFLTPIDRPQHYFEQHLSTWETPWKGFNGEDTGIIQFTPAGLAAGRYIDINASKWGLNHIRSLGVTPLPTEDEEVEPAPPDNPGRTLTQRVDAVADYGLRLLEVQPKYWCWDGGNLNVPRPGVGRPAATDGPAPKPANVRRMFCADLISFQMRFLDIPIPKNRFGDENYDGGTRSFRLRFGSRMVPFKASEFRRGDVAFVDFGTRWAPEGHIGFCLGDGPKADFLQSHLEQSCAGGEPGLNRIYSLEESHDGGYYTHRIRREDIWGAG